MKTDDLFLKALGVYLPPDRMTVEEAHAAQLCENELRDSDLVGVPIANDTPAVDLAVLAARQAVQALPRDETQIAMLIHAPMFRQGPQGWSPVGYIIRELGFGDIAGHEIVQGCNGILAAIELTAGWLRLSPEHSAALLTTALNAKAPYLDRWRSAGVGVALGDAAAAVVLGRGGGLARVDAVNSITYAELEGLHRGSLSLLEEADGRPPVVDVTLRSREFAFENAYSPFDLLKRLVEMHSEVATRSLADAGIQPGDLARVIFTNVGSAVIGKAIMEPLSLPLSLATWDFGRTVGHLGAADHIVSLDHLLSTGALSAGDRVLMLSGSPGYNVASAVLTITGTPAG
jgi:3-oxoacyl-[acyl-carrier-protein] synthase III